MVNNCLSFLKYTANCPKGSEQTQKEVDGHQNLGRDALTTSKSKQIT